MLRYKSLLEKSTRLILLRANDRSGAHPFLSETNVSGVYPALGLAYLAAAARRAGFPVSILDGHALNLSPAQITATISVGQVQAVGLSATTYNWPIVRSLARQIKATRPDIFIIVGGPQLSLFPEECLADPAIDAGVIGEGEEAVVELLDRLEQKADIAGLAGVVARRGSQIVRGPDRPPQQNLDSLPLPALDLLPLSTYRALTVSRPFISMVASRGCPYHCRYCAQIYGGGVYREHGIDRMLAEMERAVSQFGAHEIIFFDETFTINRRRVLDFCAAITNRNLRVRWNIRTRCDLLDEELMAAMYRAGCRSIHLGIESGSARGQTELNKNLDLQKIPSILETARRLGLETRGYFMIGFPGETLAEIEQTIQLAVNLPLDWASFTITMPQAGTEFYNRGAAEGRFSLNYWRDYALGLMTGAPGYFTSPEYDAVHLEALLHSAYRRFYLRPRLLASKLRGRWWSELPTLWRTLLEIRPLKFSRRTTPTANEAAK